MTIRRHVLGSIAVIVAALTGCGDDPAIVTVRDGCATTDAWTFPATAVGQTAISSLIVQRTDGGARALTVTIDGPDAGDFAIVGTDTCSGASLGDGAVCVVQLAFAPSADGARAATLHLGASALPLTGAGVVASAGVVADLSGVSVTSGLIATRDTYDVLLVNQGSSPVTLGARRGTGDGLLIWSVDQQCPAVLTPGGACRLQLTVAQSRAGCANGTFAIDSDGGTVEIPITSTFLGGVEVVGGPPAYGRITSSPPGIACGGGDGACAQVFFEDTVTLTASPRAGGHFNGWSDLRCGDAAACAVQTVSVLGESLSPGRATAAFASPAARAVSIRFPIEGVGRVTLYAYPPPASTLATACGATCTRWLEPETAPTLMATTPSRFVGWNGACVGTSRQCELGPIVNDRELTARFARDDRATATLAFPVAVTAGLFDPGGDLLIGTTRPVVGQEHPSAVVTRVRSDGTPVWSTDLTTTFASVVSIRGGPSAVYALLEGDDDDLVKLDADGAIVWRRDVGRIYQATSSALAVLGDGRVVALSIDQVTVLDADGTPAWSAPNGCGVGVGRALAASSADAIVVVCRDGTLRRFDRDGGTLPAWAIPRQDINRAAARFDDQDRLLVYVDGEPSYLARLDASGAPMFVLQHTDRGSPPGLALTSSGEPFVVEPHRRLVSGRLGNYETSAGGVVQRLDAAGAALWMVDKPHSGVPSTDPWWDSVQVADVACGAGACALFGAYGGQYGDGGWVEIFSTP